MPLFKDFNKDVKDLLTKNYQDGWKVESKLKAPDHDIIVNPQYTAKDGWSADLESADKAHGLKFKVSVGKDLSKVKPRVTYEQAGHKVEVAASLDKKYEVVYEGQYKSILIHDKLTNDNVESGLSVEIIPGLSAGAGATVTLSGQLKEWSAGVHYKNSGRVVDVTTKAAQTFTIGTLIPVAIQGHKLSVAAQIDYGKQLKTQVGIQTTCPCGTGATLKFRVDNTGALSAAIIKTYKAWTAALSYDVNSKQVGLLLTQA